MSKKQEQIKIEVEVHGGLVTEVRSNVKNVLVKVIDMDVAETEGWPKIRAQREADIHEPLLKKMKW